jgi:nucleoside-diphosphate-sugar epimerase
MSRILVTGASGFLGSFLMPRLVAAGHEAIGLKLDFESPDMPGVDWIDCDLGQPLNPSTLPQKIDGIIHLAQSPRYREGKDGEAHVFDVNVRGVADLLRYADGAGVSRFVLASSGSVYEPFGAGLNEDARVSPTGYYGASKLAAETLSTACADRFAVANLRVFFLYGPKQKNMLIARLIEQVQAGATLTLPKAGDGLVFVPTYADDTARVFQKACEDAWTGLYNVACPYPTTFRHLLETIGDATGKPPVIERNDAEPSAPIVPPLTRLRAKMDVSDFHTIEQGVAKAVAAG